MAIVRELITLLGTEVDTKGFQQYEKGIARVKELAIGVGKLFGVVFAADKIIEFADGLVSAGKEINRIAAQLKVIARPFDDMAAAQDRVFETAQRLGLEYKDVFTTFKEFYNEVRETDIPLGQVEKTTENIYKALLVGRATAEQTNQVLELFQRSFRRGGMRSIGVGMLADLSPTLLDTLGQHFDKLRVKGESNEDMLRRLAKAGKLTAEAIVGAFGQANAQLDADYAKVPMKLGRVFTIIKNDLVEVTRRIYKMTDASVFMGRMVLYVWTALRNGVKQFIEYLGGLEKAIELVGIALAVAFGPWLIKTLYLATAATLQWAAANAAALAPWLAIGAAVAAVAVGIQDLVYWIQGKPNLIGTWVGPFADLEDRFGKLDFLAPLRGFKDLITGDWSGFEKEMDKTGESAKTLLKYIEDIGIQLGLWKKPQFEGWTSDLNLIIQAMKDFVTVLNDVNRASNEAGKWVRKHILGIDDETTKTPGQFLQDLPKSANEAGKEVGKAIGAPVIGSGTVFKTDPNYWGLEFRKKLDEAFINPPAPSTSGGHWYDYLLPGMGKTGAAIGGPQPPANWMDMLPGAETFKKVGDLGLVRKPDGTLGTPGAGGLGIPPGAMGPSPVTTGDTNIQPVFNQTNSIKVETVLDAAQIGAIIGDKVGALVGEQLGSFSRSLTVGAPRVEAAIQ